MSKKKSGASFSKEQFLTSDHFTPIQKDVLRALLAHDGTYTLEQAQRRIDDFAKRTVT
jgi:hypothetical protein